MSLLLFLAVCLGGGLGSVARFVVDATVRARLGGSWPWATLLINVTGSALLGLLTGVSLALGGPTALLTVAGTGFCGGYTTFSTAMVETVRLLQRRSRAGAVGYVLASVLTTTVLAGLGIVTGRALVGAG